MKTNNRADFKRALIAVLVAGFLAWSRGTLVARADLALPDANTVYQFDGNLSDSGSNGYDAVGTASSTSYDASGLFSDAVSISPANGAVDLGDHFNRFGTSTRSYSFWYKTSKDDDGQQVLFSNRDAGNGYSGIICVLDGNNVAHDGGIECNVIDHNNTGNQFVAWTSQGHATTKDGRWHYVVVRFGTGNENPDFFFDSNLENNIEIRGAGCDATCSADSLAHTYLGIENGAAELTGAIDNFAVISHKMTDAEIANAYANGAGAKIVQNSFIPVAIDIKPDGFPNSINLGSNGVVPVAIFGSATFDVRQIDTATVKLANAPVQRKGNGQPMASYSDVNGDGFTDLVVQVSASALRLTSNDVRADLNGRLTDGAVIKGSDSVRVVP